MAKTPKTTQMSAEAEAERRERLAARTYIAPERVWDSDPSPEFGGQADIMELEVGDVAGPFTYVGHQSMTTELGDTTVHLGTDKDNNQLRMPIQATFVRSVDQAGLIRGDQFLVKRFDDIIKKRGKGAGNPMHIYAIKVVHRAPRSEN